MKHIMAQLTKVQASSVATKKKVGAVLADSKGIILNWECNRAPLGRPIEDENGETIDDLATHAEMSLMLTYGGLLSGKDIWCTLSPCKQCALHMKVAGIRKIYYLEENTFSTAYDTKENKLRLSLEQIVTE